MHTQSVFEINPVYLILRISLAAVRSTFAHQPVVKLDKKNTMIVSFDIELIR